MNDGVKRGRECVAASQTRAGILDTMVWKSAWPGKGSVGPQAKLRGWGVRLYSKLDGDVVMWKGGGSERLWAEPEKRV